MSSPTGSSCPPGQFSTAYNATHCLPCASGRYGTACTSVCLAPPGYMCDAATGSVIACPAGQYGLGVPYSCQPCTAGRYGVAVAATVATCTAACKPGRYSAAGASACTLCAAGTFAAGVGAVVCNGSCVATPGTYCPVGAVSAVPLLCPAGVCAGFGVLRLGHTGAWVVQGRANGVSWLRVARTARCRRAVPD